MFSAPQKKNLKRLQALAKAKGEKVAKAAN